MFTETDKPKLVKLTYQLAKKFRDMERFPRDRELQPARLEYLRRTMQSGEFRGAEWVSAYLEEDGKTYRINGKHTSMVACELFEAGEAPEATILLREYSCESMADMARLYGTFDPRQSARSKSDLLRAYAQVSPLIANIPQRKLQVITGALGFADYEAAYRRRPLEEQAMRLLSEVEFAAWASDILMEGKDYQHIFRLPVVAAMYTTRKKSKTDAEDFWRKIRDDCDDPREAPTRKLYRWLNRVTLYGADKGGSDKETAGYREMYARCIHCWNAWRRNEATDMKYYPQSKLPTAA